MARDSRASSPRRETAANRRLMGAAVAAAAVTILAAAWCPREAMAERFGAVGNTDPEHRARPSKTGEVVVTFDTMPTRVSFDLPGHIRLITENGIPYTNGATETYITSEGFEEGASYESWNDKDNQYSRMWIESQNDARIVVRHRCALVKGDRICHQDKPKVAPYGPGNWVDEWYIFHPDGTHIRRVKIWTAVAREAGRHGAKYPYELEGMYLWWGAPCKGKMASDHLEDGVITLIKMDGRHRTINLNPYPLKEREYRRMSGVYGEFSNANIHVINTKSKYRPWRMGRSSRTLSVTPYVPVHKQVQLVPCFPPATTKASGYSVAGLGQMNWGGFWQRTDTTISEIWLNGFTTNRDPAQELAAVARSWQAAPKMTVAAGSGVVAQVYSIGERAYLVDATKLDGPKSVQGTIAASDKSPLMTPAFLINNWGGDDAVLEIDGREVPRGADCRMGHYKSLELEGGRIWKDVLIVWAKMSATAPVRFTIRSEADRTLNAKADALEERCAAAEKKKDYALAIQLYEQYVRQFGKAARFETVKAHLESLKSDKAIQATVQRGRAGRECKRWLALAESCAASGKTDKAKQYLTKIIQEHGQTDWADRARARLAKLADK